MNKIYGLIIGLVLVFSIANVSADLLMPGTKGVGGCFKISNIDSYPEYTFLMLAYPGYDGNRTRVEQAIRDGTGMGEFRFIRTGDCIGFYKFSTAGVFATKDYVSNDVYEYGKMTGHANYSGLKLIYSDMLIGSNYRSVDENDPLMGIVETYKIVSLDDNKLVLTKESITYEYIGGKNETTYYKNDNQKVEPKGSFVLIPSWLWYSPLMFIVCLAALIAIVVIIVVKWRRRVRETDGG